MFNRQHGMGIVDFAIGSAIVLITAAVVLPQFVKVSNSTRVSQESVSCLSGAESVLSSVITQKPTQIRKFAVTTNALGGQVLSLYPKQAEYSIDWIFPDLAPSWAPVTHQGGRNIVNSVFLQTGAIARATNFYHFSVTNNEDICTNFMPIDRAIELLPNQILEKRQLRSLMTKSFSNLPGAKYSLRVRKAVSAPAGTEVLHECNRPFIPAPLSYGGIDADKGPDQSLELPQMAQDRAGLYVSVKNEFTNKEGNTESCEVSRYLAPYVDSAITNPEPEVSLDFNPGRDHPGEFKATGFPLKLPDKDGYSARNSCRISRQAFRDNPEYLPLRQDRMESDWQEPIKTIKARVQISYNNLSPGEAGTVFLCRDQSIQYNKNYCGLKNQDTIDPKLQPWVPCEMATLCGVPVDGSLLVAHSPEVGQFLVELPFVMNQQTKVVDPKTKALVEAPQAFIGCDLQMDIAAVDLAGNSYAISNSKRESYHKDLEAQRAHIFQMFYQPVDCWNCKIYKYRSLFSRLVRGALGVALYVANLYTGGAVGAVVGVVQMIAAPVAVPHPPLQETVVSATANKLEFTPDPRIELLKSADQKLSALLASHKNARCTRQSCQVTSRPVGEAADWMSPVREARNRPNPHIGLESNKPTLEGDSIYGDVNAKNVEPKREVIFGYHGGSSLLGATATVVPSTNQAVIEGLTIQKNLIQQNINLLKTADEERKNLISLAESGPPATDITISQANENQKESWFANCVGSNFSRAQCEEYYADVQNYQVGMDVYQQCAKAVGNDMYDMGVCGLTPVAPALELPGVYDDAFKKIPVATPTWVTNMQTAAKYLNTLADVYTLRMAYVNGDRKQVTKSLVLLTLANKQVREKLDKYVFDGLLNNINGAYQSAVGGIANPVATFFKDSLNISAAWSDVVNNGANAFATSLISNTLQGLLNGNLDVGQLIKDAVKSGAQAAVSSAVDKVLSAAVNDLMGTSVPMAGFLNVGLINTFGGFGHGPGKFVKETKNCTDESQTWKQGRFLSRRKWAKKCERIPIRSPAWVQTAGVPACDYNAKLHYAFPFEHINFIAGYTLPGETFEAPVYFDKQKAIVCQARFTCTGEAATKISYFTAEAPKDTDTDAADYEMRSTNFCDAIMTRVKYRFNYNGTTLSYQEVAGDTQCRMNQPFEDVYDRSGNTPVLKTEGQQMPYPSAAKYVQLYRACDKYGPLNQNPIYEQDKGKIVRTFISSTANTITYRSANCPSGLPRGACQMVSVGNWDDSTYEYHVTQSISRDLTNYHLCQPVMKNGLAVSINFPTDINANLPKISREFYVLEHRAPYDGSIPNCFANSDKLDGYKPNLTIEPGFNILERHQLNLEKEMLAEAANLCGQINKDNISSGVTDLVLSDSDVSNLTATQKQTISQFRLGFDSLSISNFADDFKKTSQLNTWAKDRGNYHLARSDYSTPVAPYCSGYEDIDVGSIDDEFGNPLRTISVRCNKCSYSPPPVYDGY